MLKRFRAAWRAFTRAPSPMTRTEHPEFFSVDWDRQAFAVFGTHIDHAQEEVIRYLPFPLQIELVRTGVLAQIEDHLRDMKPYVEDLEALRDLASNTSESAEIRQALERLASVVKGSPGQERAQAAVTNMPAGALTGIHEALNRVAQGNGQS